MPFGVLSPYLSGPAQRMGGGAGIFPPPPAAPQQQSGGLFGGMFGGGGAVDPNYALMAIGQGIAKGDVGGAFAQ